MSDQYYQQFSQWVENTGFQAVYDRLDVLFPAYEFRRKNPGSADRDHWASRKKMDLTLPKRRNAEKTVVYRFDMNFREQGEWDTINKTVFEMLEKELGVSGLFPIFDELDRRYSLGMPREDSAAFKARKSASQRRQELLSELRKYFVWNLMNNTSAKAEAVRRYLRKEREFTLRQAESLGLGFVPDWSKVVANITLKCGYSYEELEDACNVMGESGKTTVGKSHTLAIPYECAGELKGFLFRAIGDDFVPKYRANTGLDRKGAFFNIPADRNPKDIVVVEGEFDALKATSIGVEGVVAIGGSELAGDRIAQVEDALSRRGVRGIILCLDLDTDRDGNPNSEGRFNHVMASVHTIKDVDDRFDDIRVVRFPYPTDPDEYIRKEGADAFRQLLDEAVPYWQYLYEYKTKR